MKNRNCEMFLISDHSSIRFPFKYNNQNLFTTLFYGNWLFFKNCLYVSTNFCSFDWQTRFKCFEDIESVYDCFLPFVNRVISCCVSIILMKIHALSVLIKKELIPAKRLTSGGWQTFENCCNAIPNS